MDWYILHTDNSNLNDILISDKCKEFYKIIIYFKRRYYLVDSSLYESGLKTSYLIPIIK